MVSEKLRIAIYLDKRRCYQIAYEAGLHPNVMSMLINGIRKAKSNDPRVIAVGRVVGVSPEDCFELEPEDTCES